MATSPVPEFSSDIEYQCWLRRCAGKDKFPTLEAAEGYLRLRRRGEIRDKRYGRPNEESRHLDAYFCDFCAHFHLGHPKPTG